MTPVAGAFAADLANKPTPFCFHIGCSTYSGLRPNLQASLMRWIFLVEPTTYAKATLIDEDDVALSLRESALLLGALGTLAASILSLWTL